MCVQWHRKGQPICIWQCPTFYSRDSSFKPLNKSGLIMRVCMKKDEECPIIENIRKDLVTMQMYARQICNILNLLEYLDKFMRQIRTF